MNATYNFAICGGKNLQMNSLIPDMAELLLYAATDIRLLSNITSSRVRNIVLLYCNVQRSIPLAGFSLNICISIRKCSKNSLQML